MREAIWPDIWYPMRSCLRPIGHQSTKDHKVLDDQKVLCLYIDPTADPDRESETSTAPE